MPLERDVTKLCEWINEATLMICNLSTVVEIQGALMLDLQRRIEDLEAGRD